MLKKLTMPVLAFWILLLLSACAPIKYKAYEGAAMQPAEIAILSIDRNTWVHAIDGKPTGITTYGIGEMGVDFELTPGSHILSVSYSSLAMMANSSSTTSVTTYSKGQLPMLFEFKKGRKYEIHYKIDKVFEPVIVDVTETTPRKGSFAQWGKL